MPSYSDNVFINCPFDEDYTEIFRALIFSVYDCGFYPRCALEISNSAQTRIDKIESIIENCLFGIHDISRTELDPVNNLPRFNMPIELGLFLGARKFGNNRQKKKVCLILDSEKYRYQKFCSDISGQDISSHNKNSKTVIRITRDWLQGHKSNIQMPGGSTISKRYDSFLKNLPIICTALKLDETELTFVDFRNTVYEWLIANPW